MPHDTNVPMKILIAIDILILLINIGILVLSILVTLKEKSYRKTINIFLFQLIESAIAFGLNVLMFVLNFVLNYKGHNLYGMFIRFILFYLVVSCVTLSYQRGDNLNIEIFKKYGRILLYIGLANNLFIILSMIISFIVSDKKSYDHKEKDIEDKVYNINNQYDETMEIFDREKSGGSMQEFDKPIK